jgi:hypothetical protein
MPPARKRQKMDSVLLKELVNYREEIKRLNDSPPLIEIEENLEENLKIFVKSQIRESENRIVRRMDRRLDSIEKKLNGLLNVLGRMAENGQQKEEQEDTDYEVEEDETGIEIEDPLQSIEVHVDDGKNCLFKNYFL